MASRARISTIDEELLRKLEQAFAHHAGEAGAIDAAALQRALGLRSEYLARRVLRNFDRDGDGSIDRGEFVDGVRSLVFGSDREKLLFAFRLHDEDGDGFISRLELLRMIAIGLAEDEVQTRASQPPEQLTHLLLTMADKDFDGRLSFAEFEAAVRSHPRLLAQMTQSEASWIAPNEDILDRVDAEPEGRWASLLRYCDNRRAELAWLAAFALVAVALFWAAMTGGRGGRQVDGVMQLGRALGACLDFVAALILWPVMRRLLTRVRASRLARFVPVDYALDVHRWLGHALLALGLLHGLAFAASYASGHAGAPLGTLLLRSRRGATGAGLLVLLGAMWAFALPAIRRSSRFELFYFTHLLYAAWLALLVLHAPESIPWLTLPLAAWALEQVWRVRRRGRRSTVASSQTLRSGVTLLEIERPADFDQKPGDYVFLRIPALARHEWHPFTLSGAPENPRLSVHVRSLGNWTSALRRLVEERHTSGTEGPMEVQMDGPYGSPNMHIFESRCAVLIGAGIGVTPFASVLESLVLRANRADEQRPALRKAHFFWLNRDQYSFEWFGELLEELEVKDAQELLDIHICMTGGRAGATAAGLEIARAILHQIGRRDMVTGLRAMTHMGHPDWRSVLAGIAAEHAPEPVDVYFCGPGGLGRKLRRICRELGLRYREEQF